MTKKKLFLLIQSALCVLLAILLASAAIGICREGMASQEEDPLESIYTREKVAERLAPIAPLFVASLALTALGLILGVRDDAKPARDLAGIAARRKTKESRPERALGLLRALLLAAALLLILAGVWNGGARDVLSKAARICTECVGLG